MVRIFPTVFEFDPVWKGFYPSVSDSEYSISVTDLYSNTQKLHFYDVDIHCNLIQQKLALSVFDSVFEQKYENKYDISNIRPYPIRLHPYLATQRKWHLLAYGRGVVMGHSPNALFTILFGLLFF